MNKIKLVVNNGFKKREKEKFFIKKELQCILNLYAKMVSNGSWKDYSFSSCTKEISFDVYQRTSDKPVIKITKNLKPIYLNEKYFIKDKDLSIRGIEISTNHVRSVSEGFVYAKATNVHLGRTMQIWEVRVTDEYENLISLGKLTTLAINKK